MRDVNCNMINRRTFFGTCLAGSATVLYGCGQGSGHVAANLASDNSDPTRQIGSDRDAVRNECWYALNQSYSSKPNDANGPANGSSTWHYIASDTGVLAYLLKTYKAAVTERIPYTGELRESVDYWVKILSDPNDQSNYGMNWKGIKAGHGLQCVSFVTAVIYRARGGAQNAKARIAWSYRSPIDNGPATSADVGDIIWRKDSDSSGHLAICVKNANGVITVVDSNWQTTTNAEVINKHDFNYGSLNGWRKYSGKGIWY